MILGIQVQCWNLSKCPEWGKRGRFIFS